MWLLKLHPHLKNPALEQKNWSSMSHRRSQQLCSPVVSHAQSAHGLKNKFKHHLFCSLLLQTWSAYVFWFFTEKNVLVYHHPLPIFSGCSCTSKIIECAFIHLCPAADLFYMDIHNQLKEWITNQKQGKDFLAKFLMSSTEQKLLFGLFMLLLD